MKPKRPRIFATVERAAPEDGSDPAGNTCPWWAHGLALLGLLLANLALYSGTVGLGFLPVDDPDYVQNNPHIESFSAANLKHILTTPYSANYAVIRNEGVTHALFAIGVAYWSMGNYVEAEPWLLEAQAVQRKSGQAWLPALDQEVERIKRLAAGK